MQEEINKKIDRIVDDMRDLYGMFSLEDSNYNIEECAKLAVATDVVEKLKKSVWK